MVETRVEIGSRVELYVGYTNAWAGGFEVVDVVEGGYQVRRVADGRLLPAPTSPADLRQPRRHIP